MFYEGFVSPAPKLELYYLAYPAISSPDISDNEDSINGEPSTLPARERVEVLDLTKPTILLLHPIFWDVTAFKPQLSDPRFRSRFNALGFDSRASGRTRSQLDPAYDPSVAAADIVISLSRIPINLPEKIHLLAVDCWSTALALCIAALFPASVASLTLHGLSDTDNSSEGDPVRFAAFQEMQDSWCTPKEREEYLETIAHTIETLLGKIPDNVMDALGQVLTNRYPPSHTAIAWYSWNPFQTRDPIPPELFEDIKCPVVIIHGDQDFVYPVGCAYSLKDRFTRTEVELAIVPDVGHLVFFLQPQAFDRIHLDFMHKHFPPAPDTGATFVVPPSSKFSPDFEKAKSQVRKMAAEGSAAPFVSSNSKQPILPSDFYAGSEQHKADNNDYIQLMHQWNERNWKMFPDWPVWWEDEVEGKRIEKEMPCKLSRRHFYLEEHYPGRDDVVNSDCPCRFSELK